MVKLTVALPLFKSKLVAWLAMESLTRQKNINFEWEIVTLEESGLGAFGQDSMMEYFDKLKDIGCQRIKYVPLDNWIPLSLKWKHIALEAQKNSEVFLLVAADNYAGPNRLRNTYDLFLDKNVDWVQKKRGLFYNIIDERTILYDWDSYKGKIGNRCALDMATRTKFVRNIPDGDWGRCVDSWMFKQCRLQQKDKKLRIAWDNSPDWKGCLHTNGLNGISDRRSFFKQPTPPFVETSIKISDNIPLDIVKKLKQAKDSIQEHKNIKNTNKVILKIGKR